MLVERFTEARELLEEAIAVAKVRNCTALPVFGWQRLARSRSGVGIYDLVEARMHVVQEHASRGCGSPPPPCLVSQERWGWPLPA
jgi:hypothetical protein